MIVKVHELIGNSTASGAAVGLAAVATVAQTIPTTCADDLVILDFGGIELATGSFLRSFVLGLREHCRSPSRAMSVVAANLTDAVLEELVDRLMVMREAVAICLLSPKGAISAPRVIGIVEERQREALAAVIKAGETDAPTLAEHDAEPDASANKWNNRLAALAAKGLLKERREGRLKRYSPILPGLHYGP